MTLEQRIAAMVSDWQSAGQHEHAAALRAQMEKLFAQYLRGKP